MVLIPVLAVVSGYSLLYTPPQCPCTAGLCLGCADVLSNVPATFRDTINAWTVGGIVAVSASLLFAAFPRLRRIASGLFVFAALVYWSGFFGEAFIPFVFITTTSPVFFAWPPVLLIAGFFLVWVSEARGPLSKGFWLSFIGGFLMLSLSLPAFVVWWWFYVRGASSPYNFLAIGLMVFGGMLTVLVSLVLGIFRSSGGAARVLSFSGLLYYWLGLAILLAASGGFAGSGGDALLVFTTLGLFFSLPALAARLIIAWGQRHHQKL